MSDNTTIARALFDAFQAGDTDAASALLAPDFKGTQNGGPASNRAMLMGFLDAVHAKTQNFRYEEITCTATATGFVEEHAVRADLPGGEVFDVTLCVVGEVVDGKITALREYADNARAAGLAKALVS